MLILAFESSCDETSVAVCDIDKNHRTILSNKTATQIPTHALYGGVVPEIASRAHTEAISNLTYMALEEAGKEVSDMDIIAVTANPGLIGALLVGVNFAKGIAAAFDKPIVAVNHIKGHAAATYFEYQDLNAPFFALIASGGHTSMMNVTSPTVFEPVARTRDDAAGEAFDKVARVLGLPYPGGAQMDLLASKGNKDAIKFPSAAVTGSLDFSFSGLKTAVINYVNTQKQKGIEICPEDLAASFTGSVTTSVVKNLEGAHDKYGFKDLVFAGGVAANSHLRAAISDFCQRRGVRLRMPSIKFCGDNGAMIAAQAYYEYMAGNIAGDDLNAHATSRHLTL